MNVMAAYLQGYGIGLSSGVIVSAYAGDWIVYPAGVIAIAAMTTAYGFEKSGSRGNTE